MSRRFKEEKPKQLEKLVFCSECRHYRSYLSSNLEKPKMLMECTAHRTVNYNPFCWWYEYPDPGFKNKNNRCVDFEPKNEGYSGSWRPKKGEWIWAAVECEWKLCVYNRSLGGDMHEVATQRDILNGVLSITFEIAPFEGQLPPDLDEGIGEEAMLQKRDEEDV